jgi:hypothetical protein
MTETLHRRLEVGKRAKYAIELLYIDIVGPFKERLDGSRY